MHMNSPNGQYPMCPSFVTIGTLRRQTRKSAAARFVMKTLVTVFMCGRRIVRITSRLPPTPKTKITACTNKRRVASSGGSLSSSEGGEVVQLEGKEALKIAEQFSADMLMDFLQELLAELAELAKFA